MDGRKIDEIEEPGMTKKTEVIEWLKAHPDLFSNQPELLDHMNLPHQAGAASLIERQVERLREENRVLNKKLKALAGIAGENERLMQRLHQLTLELMATDSPTTFIEQLLKKLADDFQADSVRLHLLAAHPELEPMVEISVLGEERPAWLAQLLDQGRTECGRLTREKMDLLFGDQFETLGSAALVPIADIGVLAIGSNAVERFYPGMGTLFIELLGATVRCRLQQPGAEHRKRA
jgi:uncharacterized protein YigA (DUF484 family)